MCKKVWYSWKLNISLLFNFMNKIFCYNTIVSVQCTNVLLNFYFSLTSIFPVSELSFFHLWNSKIYNIGQYLWGCWLTKTKWEIIRLFPTYRRQRKLQHIRYVYRVIRIRTVFKPHIRYSDSCERGLKLPLKSGFKTILFRCPDSLGW